MRLDAALKNCFSTQPPPIMRIGVTPWATASCAICLASAVAASCAIDIVLSILPLPRGTIGPTAMCVSADQGISSTGIRSAWYPTQ